MIDAPARTPANPAQHTDERVWGWDLHGLHDAEWASRGVIVVRPGQRPRRAPSRSRYLLLDRHEVVDFDLPARSGRPDARVQRVTIDDAASAYSEQIETTARGTLRAVHRRYADTLGHRAMHVLLTSDARVASRWGQAPSRRDARRELRTLLRPARWARTTVRGRRFDPRRDTDRDGYVERLLRRGAPIGDLHPSVTEVKPGVWAHRSARIDAAARLIAPAWIGAGAHVHGDDVIVGPCVVGDQVATSAPTSSIMDSHRAHRSAELPPATPRAVPVRSRPGKRCFDLIVASVGLVLAAPLFPLIMAAIWLEDGRPFLFAHRRQTIGGARFRCLKFRTMCRDADRMKAALASRNQSDGPQFHMTNDPRMLRVGRVLRRFHLDELPQLWNVVRGEMSLVGPRPSPERENQCCPLWREARLSVRPGMTGLWQVRRTRAPHQDFREWIEFDLEYCRRQSWRLDLEIMATTILRVLGIRRR